jgi:hypothetical protein
MKTMFFAATAALVAFGRAADALAARAPTPTTVQTTYTAASASTTASAGRPAQASIQRESPTGLPSYEMRSDGLMINGLLPAYDWQG